jgi:hypothetical protein
VIDDWLPVVLRLAILALSLSQLRYLTESFAKHGVLFLQPGVLLIIAIILLVLGAAARISSVVALFALGFSQLINDLTLTQILLGVACTGILYMGSGLYSLWRPEDQLVFRRAGKPRLLDAGGEG